LNHLAVERRTSASTQNQALCALVFLYRRVLALDLPEDVDLKRRQILVRRGKGEQIGPRSCRPGLAPPSRSSSSVSPGGTRPSLPPAEAPSICCTPEPEEIGLGAVEVEPAFEVGGPGRSSRRPSALASPAPVHQATAHGA
jgi:hypothetical protein